MREDFLLPLCTGAAAAGASAASAPAEVLDEDVREEF